MRLTSLFLISLLAIKAGLAAESEQSLSPTSDAPNKTIILDKIILQTNESITPEIEILGKKSSNCTVINGYELYGSQIIIIELPEPLLICKTQEQTIKHTTTIQALKKFDKEYNLKAVDSSTFLKLSYRHDSTPWDWLSFGMDYQHEQIIIERPLEHYFDNINEQRSLQLYLVRNSQEQLELKQDDAKNDNEHCSFRISYRWKSTSLDIIRNTRHIL